jgi:hypothetical protein
MITESESIVGAGLVGYHLHLWTDIWGNERYKVGSPPVNDTDGAIWISKPSAQPTEPQYAALVKAGNATMVLHKDGSVEVSKLHGKYEVTLSGTGELTALRDLINQALGQKS